MEKWIGQVVGEMHMIGITQIQLAKQMGVTNDYISLILKGKRNPKNIDKRIFEAIENIKKSKKEID